MLCGKTFSSILLDTTYTIQREIYSDSLDTIFSGREMASPAATRNIRPWPRGALGVVYNLLISPSFTVKRSPEAGSFESNFEKPRLGGFLIGGDLGNEGPPSSFFSLSRAGGDRRSDGVQERAAAGVRSLAGRRGRRWPLQGLRHVEARRLRRPLLHGLLWSPSFSPSFKSNPFFCAVIFAFSLSYLLIS